MSVLTVKGVTLAYPIYSMRAKSLRNAVANLAVGGRLLRNRQDIVHIQALKNISFKLAEGDRLGLVGHNGSGKTTLLKVLAGVYEPDHGVVSVRGKISSMININLGLDAELTGVENIYNMGRMRGQTTNEIKERLQEIIDFSDLGQFIDLPLKTYSAGMITRLVFGVATSMNPDILLMDEWIGAGDAGFFEKAKRRLDKILQDSRIMVLATHSDDLIKRLCNKILVLEGGSQVYFGDIDGWDFERAAQIQNANDQLKVPKVISS